MVRRADRPGDAYDRPAPRAPAQRVGQDAVHLVERAPRGRDRRASRGRRSPASRPQSARRAPISMFAESTPRRLTPRRMNGNTVVVQADAPPICPLDATAAPIRASAARRRARRRRPDRRRPAQRLPLERPVALRGGLVAASRTSAAPSSRRRSASSGLPGARVHLVAEPGQDVDRERSDAARRAEDEHRTVAGPSGPASSRRCDRQRGGEAGRAERHRVARREALRASGRPSPAGSRARSA